MFFKQTEQQIEHLAILSCLDSLDIAIFNKQREIEQSKAYNEEQRATYKAKLIKEQIKPLKTVKQHLNRELSIIELKFLY